MKTIQQDLKSNNLTRNEATIVAQESSTLETAVDVPAWKQPWNTEVSQVARDFIVHTNAAVLQAT